MNKIWYDLQGTPGRARVYQDQNGDQITMSNKALWEWILTLPQIISRISSRPAQLTQKLNQVYNLSIPTDPVTKHNLFSYARHYEYLHDREIEKMKAEINNMVAMERKGVGIAADQIRFSTMLKVTPESIILEISNPDMIDISHDIALNGPLQLDLKTRKILNPELNDNAVRKAEQRRDDINVQKEREWKQRSTPIGELMYIQPDSRDWLRNLRISKENALIIQNLKQYNITIEDNGSRSNWIIIKHNGETVAEVQVSFNPDYESDLITEINKIKSTINQNRESSDTTSQQLTSIFQGLDQPTREALKDISLTPAEVTAAQELAKRWFSLSLNTEARTHGMTMLTYHGQPTGETMFNNGHQDTQFAVIQKQYNELWWQIYMPNTAKRVIGSLWAKEISTGESWTTITFNNKIKMTVLGEKQSTEWNKLSFGPDVATIVKYETNAVLVYKKDGSKQAVTLEKAP